LIGLVAHGSVGHDATGLAKRGVILHVFALDPLQRRFVVERRAGRTPEQHELKCL
jgi:hypothetical protein